LTTEQGATVTFFVRLRIVASVQRPVTFPDTITYTQLDFLGRQERLWTLPLIYNILPANDLREAFQVLVGAASWSLLAVNLRQVLTHRSVARIAIGAVLLLGLVPQVTVWDSIMLSESLTISLTVLEVALLIRLYNKRSPGADRRLPRSRTAARLHPPGRGADLLGRAPIRDPARRHQIAAARGRIGGRRTDRDAAWCAFAVSHDKPPADYVWIYNANTIIVNRIAADPAALHYFLSHGMPYNSAFANEAGNFLGMTSTAWKDNRFMHWLEHDFRRVYVIYLLRHLPPTLVEPIIQMFKNVSVYTTGSGEARAVLPGPVAAMLWSDSEGDVPFWLTIAFIV
jgi:hypothetical protein